MEALIDIEEPDVIASPVYVVFFAAFRPETARALLETMSQCANEGTEEVHLLMGTSGGGVDAGVNVYNMLRGMPFPTNLDVENER